VILNPVNIFQSVGVTMDAVFGDMCREIFFMNLESLIFTL